MGSSQDSDWELLIPMVAERLRNTYVQPEASPSTVSTDTPADPTSFKNSQANVSHEPPSSQANVSHEPPSSETGLNNLLYSNADDLKSEGPGLLQPSTLTPIHLICSEVARRAYSILDESEEMNSHELLNSALLMTFCFAGLDFDTVTTRLRCGQPDMNTQFLFVNYAILYQKKEKLFDNEWISMGWGRMENLPDRKAGTSDMDSSWDLNLDSCSEDDSVYHLPTEAGRKSA